MATITVTPGHTYGTTDTVTSTNLNDLGSPTAALTAGSILTADIADANVTFAKLTDVIDDNTMATATDATLATSESIKAYVDTFVQKKRVSSTTDLEITEVIPLDNTIPQSNEGSEILSTTFTPTSTSNKLEIEFDGFLVAELPTYGMVLALFEDGTCVGARWFSQASNGATSSRIGFQITPSSTSSTTYSLRFGVGASGSGNVYVNRQSNAQATLGGLQEYSMTIQEVKASA